MKKTMKARGVAVHVMPFAPSLTRDYQKRPKRAYAALRAARHDVFIFHEFMADGFFCLQAKRCGEAFTGARMGIVTHGSSLWVDEGNGCVATDSKRRHLYGMEKTCCEMAEFLVSPSEYLLDWMRDKAWTLPKTTRRIPNLTSSPGNVAQADMPRKHLAGQDIREIVFFGRLEERKGVRVFCDALNLLPDHLLRGRKITFLGKEDHFRAGDIRSWLSPALQKNEISLSFHKKYNSDEARAYLRRDGVLAVMPSLRENSPCTVSECLENGIPFIASSVGGGQELIEEDGREDIFFFPQGETLARRLAKVLGVKGAAVARPAWTGGKICEDWRTLLHDVSAQLR
jgi:glycosyltransferase involved in cell wall biosynthesis